MSMLQQLNQYEKLRISLRYFLIGKEFFRAADALEFAAQHHCGLRKDGITPEYQHQVEIAHYIRTLLPTLAYPEDTLIAALLHDVSEDYDVSISEIASRYGERVAAAVFLLDKNGKTTENYFQGIAGNEIASVVKGADRMHNLQSMVGVFSIDKQKKYVAEVEGEFLTMLKTARRNFTRQEAAYENIKHVLISQVELLKAFLDTEQV